MSTSLHYFNMYCSTVHHGVADTQQTQNICITFVQCWASVEDVGPKLYKCYTNVLCSLGIMTASVMQRKQEWRLTCKVSSYCCLSLHGSVVWCSEMNREMQIVINENIIISSWGINSTDLTYLFYATMYLKYLEFCTFAQMCWNSHMPRTHPFVRGSV